MNHLQTPSSSHLHLLRGHRILHIFSFSSEVYASALSKTSQKRRPINFVAQKTGTRAKQFVTSPTFHKHCLIKNECNRKMYNLTFFYIHECPKVREQPEKRNKVDLDRIDKTLFTFPFMSLWRISFG